MVDTMPDGGGVPRNAAGESSVEVLHRLEVEYCPPLDAALLAALALDHEPTSERGLASLRELLDSLRAEAIADQIEQGLATAGDAALRSSAPSTNGRNRLTDMESDLQSLEESMRSLQTLSESSASTKPSSTQSHFHISEATGGAFRADMPEPDKLRYLQDMFPAIDRYTVRHSLGKCDGDVDKCMDLLLNLAFFDDVSRQSGTNGSATSASGDCLLDDLVVVPRGVEGFAENAPGMIRGTGKRKGGRRKLNGMHRRNGGQSAQVHSQPPYSFDGRLAGDTQGSISASNKWASATADVDFIVSRTRLSPAYVTSTYHAQSANLSATIHVLAEAEVRNRGARSLLQEPVTSSQVVEMETVFASALASAATARTQLDDIDHKFAGLLSISRNVISAAVELAQVMLQTDSPTSHLPNIIFQPAPLELDNAEIDRSLEDAPQLGPATSSVTQTSTTRAKALSQTPTSPPLGYDASLNAAQSHYATSTSAFNAASAAYRRSRSDRLYSGVAAHYASVGREQLALAKSSSEAAADALVASQSGHDFLDLHGVTIQHAVRIAREEVKRWWDARGDEKLQPRAKWARQARNSRGEREGKDGGYKIVTGAGRHTTPAGRRLSPNHARFPRPGIRPTHQHQHQHQQQPIHHRQHQRQISRQHGRLQGAYGYRNHDGCDHQALRHAPLPEDHRCYQKTRLLAAPQCRRTFSTSRTAMSTDKRTDEEWRAVLSPEQFRILREKGTEPPGTGKYDSHYPSKGVYTCAACDAPLYTAQHKFKSGCGWPAYFDAIPGAVTRHVDKSMFGMPRTEICCAKCGGHLGHVFKGEGYKTPTDERHCVNSISLNFKDE
ncbi:hypothetical protein KEM52_004962 [Ascosphaera acerosa]|nr:hypothetical protein KEM52_004962 [Ascosphaera acerosa]